MVGYGGSEARGGRHSLLRIALGVVTAVIGVLVLAWPQRTLLTLAVLFGIELVILGLVRLAALIAVPMDQGFRWMTLIVGVLTVLAGIFCFFRPSASLVVLALFFAAGFIADGIADLARVGTLGPSGSARVAVIVSAGVSIAAGLLVAVFPGTSLVVLTRVAGIVLIAVGAVQIYGGLSARREEAAVSSV